MRNKKSLLTFWERSSTPVELLGRSERELRQYWDNIYKQPMSKEDQDLYDLIQEIKREEI